MSEDNRPDDIRQVDDQESLMEALFSRMDNDADLYRLTTYYLTDAQGRQIPNVNHTTLNRPKVYAERVMAALNGANMQIVVEGDSLDDKQETDIEDFLNGVFTLIDERLQEEREIPSLRAFLVEQACLRGRLAGRYLQRIEGDEFIPDLLPMDSRYLTYELSKNGLKWFAYRTARTKEEIEDEYGIDLKTTDATITDLWNDTEERVYAENTLLQSWPHNCDYTPGVIQVVPVGSMFNDTGAIQYSGESIFAANRNLYGELNRVATIWNTLNEASLHGSMQYKSEAGEGAAKPVLPPYGKRMVIPVDKEGGYFPMPINDIKNASQLWYGILDGAIQQGSLPSVNYGELQFPLSAVAITKLVSAEGEIFVPRLQALALFYRRLAKMIIDQYMQGGVTQELKVPRKKSFEKKKIAPDRLDGDYDISFTFQTEAPEQNIANFSIAQAAERYLSMDTIKRDVIKVDNPEDEEQKMAIEQAERMIPQLALFKMGHAAIDQGRTVEAKIIAQHLGITVESLRTGQMEAAQDKTQPAAPAESEPKPNPLVPLMQGNTQQQGAQAGGTNA